MCMDSIGEGEYARKLSCDHVLLGEKGMGLCTIIIIIMYDKHVEYVSQ